jgi:hypothetical protein
MKNAILWDVASCGFIIDRRFVGTEEQNDLFENLKSYKGANHQISCMKGNNLSTGDPVVTQHIHVSTFFNRTLLLNRHH